MEAGDRGQPAPLQDITGRALDMPPERPCMSGEFHPTSARRPAVPESVPTTEDAAHVSRPAVSSCSKVLQLTPSGPVTVVVPRHSRRGDVVRIVGCGVPGPRGRGDLFVELGS